MACEFDFIHVVLASDRKFLPYTAVTIASLLKSYRDRRRLRVYLLLNEGMSDDDRRSYQALKRIHDFDLVEIPTDPVEFADIWLPRQITVATFSRMYMAQLLPADVTRILYLDSDVLIINSISELYDVKLEPNTLIAGVQDASSLQYIRDYNLPAGAPHINAGVMVVNLDLMRRIDFTRKVSEYLAAMGRRLSLGDQQIFNSVFYTHIKYVPLRWNMHGRIYLKGWAEKNAQVTNTFSVDEINAAVKRPAIIHFTGQGAKPWASHAHPWAPSWLRYLKLTDYDHEVRAALPPHRKPWKYWVKSLIGDLFLRP